MFIRRVKRTSSIRCDMVVDISQQARVN